MKHFYMRIDVTDETWNGPTDEFVATVSNEIDHASKELLDHITTSKATDDQSAKAEDDAL